MKRVFTLIAVLFVVFSGALYFFDEVLGSRSTDPSAAKPRWFATGRARAADPQYESAPADDPNESNYPALPGPIDSATSVPHAGDLEIHGANETTPIAAPSADLDGPSVTEANPVESDEESDGAVTATDSPVAKSPRRRTPESRFSSRTSRATVSRATVPTERAPSGGSEHRQPMPSRHGSNDSHEHNWAGATTEQSTDPNTEQNAEQSTEPAAQAPTTESPFELGRDVVEPPITPPCDAGCDGQEIGVSPMMDSAITSPAANRHMDESHGDSHEVAHGEAHAEVRSESHGEVHSADMAQRLTARTQAARAAAEGRTHSAAQSDHARAGKKLPARRGAPGEAVVLQWITPAEMSVGQPAACRLIVHNAAAAVVDRVEVQAAMPEHLRIDQSSLAAHDVDGRIVWAMGQLAPGETKAIDLEVTATNEGDFNPVASVTFSHTCEARIQALRPQLELAIEGPQQVLTGQNANYAIVVSNVGTGRASAVTVSTHLDGALHSATGEQKSYSIGTLAAGETRRIVVNASAADVGTCRILARAVAKGNLQDDAQLEVEAVCPRVELGFAGPRLRYVDHEAAYTLRVHNPGRAAASNVQVVAQLPPGLRFEEADGGATCDAERGQVTWFVGNLEADQACQFNLCLRAVEVGDQPIAVNAMLESGSSQTAEFVTRVEGIADVVVEVIDSQDPVELGGETVYEVRVSNRGSQPAHQVQAAARLSSGCEALDTQGPTRGKIERAQVVFEPIADLEPGATETYQVRVACSQVGQFGFRAFVRCQGQPRPAVEEELTRVYEE